MKKNTMMLIILGLTLLFSEMLNAQENTGPVAGKMKPFAWMEGNWKGEAWYMGPDRTKTVIVQSEKVTTRVDGTLITMEGTGFRNTEDSQDMEVVFRAFGILTWDMHASKYVLRAYRGGNYIDSDLVSNEEGTFSWFIELPYGQTRYTLRLTEDGKWNEKGEFSRDGGQTWIQNFEMLLSRE